MCTSRGEANSSQQCLKIKAWAWVIINKVI